MKLSNGAAFELEKIGTGGIQASKGSFTINVRGDIFSLEGGGREIFKKRSDISILVAFSSGHFRSREGGGKNLKNRNVRRTLISNDP